MGVRLGRHSGGALVFQADLSKGPAGQLGVRVYTGGVENRGEKVREVNPGDEDVAVAGGVISSFKQVTSWLIVRGSDPELAP